MPIPKESLETICLESREMPNGFRFFFLFLLLVKGDDRIKGKLE